MYVIIIGSSIIILLVIILLLGLGSNTSGSVYTRRQCPVCNRELGQDERVFADEIKRASQPNQLKIKGCSNCYER